MKITHAPANHSTEPTITPTKDRPAKTKSLTQKSNGQVGVIEALTMLAQEIWDKITGIFTKKQ